MTVFEWLEEHAEKHDVRVTIGRESEQPEGKEPWSVGLIWGREAPDSPMAAAAAFGMGNTLGEALAEAAADCGWRPS